MILDGSMAGLTWTETASAIVILLILTRKETKNLLVAVFEMSQNNQGNLYLHIYAFMHTGVFPTLATKAPLPSASHTAESYFTYCPIEMCRSVAAYRVPLTLTPAGGYKQG